MSCHNQAISLALESFLLKAEPQSGLSGSHLMESPSTGGLPDSQVITGIQRSVNYFQAPIQWHSSVCQLWCAWERRLFSLCVGEIGCSVFAVRLHNPTISARVVVKERGYPRALCAKHSSFSFAWTTYQSFHCELVIHYGNSLYLHPGDRLRAAGGGLWVCHNQWEWCSFHRSTQWHLCHARQHQYNTFALSEISVCINSVPIPGTSKVMFFCLCS